MENRINYTNDDLPINQKVEILDGAFAGFKGVIYSINRVNRKLVVKVNFWGKDTPVELHFYQVKPVE